MNTITLNGFDAVLVAELSNRAPETVTPEGAWKSVMLHKARILASDEPTSVRLRVDARRLAQDVLKLNANRADLPHTAVDLRIRLKALALLVGTRDFTWDISELQRAALEIIADKLQ